MGRSWILAVAFAGLLATGCGLVDTPASAAETCLANDAGIEGTVAGAFHTTAGRLRELMPDNRANLPPQAPDFPAILCYLDTEDWTVMFVIADGMTWVQGSGCLGCFRIQAP